jgi:cytochrome c biogenesis protein
MRALTRSWLELFSSMRFAISLLTIIAVASVIGTVLRQNEPYANYLNQFGPFWFPLFERLGLYSVYSAAWFLLILAFLVASTAFCVWRNAPKMLREIGRFHEQLREQAFDNFSQSAGFHSSAAPGEITTRLSGYLRSNGFSLLQTAAGESTLIAAKAGMLRRVGYVFAHTAIVLICLGGLADSEFLLKLQLATGAKRTSPGSMLLSQVPPESRLPANNWSFRGNTLIPEGRSSDIAVLNVGDGILVQELPYTVSLKKFVIEHYSTGAPKLFASDVVVTDKDTGVSFEARIEVNQPLIHKGIAAYQASFDDGGTRLVINARNLMAGSGVLREMEARVGESKTLNFGNSVLTLEVTGFRAFNIENVAGPEAKREDPTLLSRMKERFGAAARTQGKKDFRNVGPSFQYKLRDASGQAREYNNYMLPVDIEGRWFLISGMRETPNDPFRFLRLPMDESGALDEFLRLRTAVFDKAAYAEVGHRFARSAGAGDAVSETMRTRLAETAERVLETFSRHGFQSVAEFLEAQVPEAEREKAAEIYVRVLQGAAWEAWMLARERDGKPRLEGNTRQVQFVQDSLNALSDAFFYGVPLYLQLSGFDEVKASVLQLTRSPGKAIVYWGCAFLVLGIFAMFFIRERRLWFLIKPSGEVRMALSSNRSSLDVDEEFARHRDAVARLLR